MRLMSGQDGGMYAKASSSIFLPPIYTSCILPVEPAIHAAMTVLSYAQRTGQRLYGALLFRDHFAPHSRVHFEGFYSRTLLDDGGTLAIVFCWVKNATERPNLVHISYTPSPSTPSSPAFKHEFFPDHLEVTTHAKLHTGRQPFAVHMAGVGVLDMRGDSVEYTIKTSEPELELSLKVTEHVPWSASTPLAGPMGPLSLLSSLLPLNWHVLCTSSKATYKFTHAGRTQSGTGTSHVEKNWGASFPPGWIWSQSFSFAGPEPSRSLCLAGGSALLGVQAYLVGYRSAALHWDFRPPFAMALWKLSAFMTVEHDSKAGTFALTVQTFTRKLVIKVDAPTDSFIGLACPYANGHRPMYAFESFTGRTWIEAWERAYPWQRWSLVEEGPGGLTSEGEPCSALEFGGFFSHVVRENAKKEA
jgi:tocopherol cyclase